MRIKQKIRIYVDFAMILLMPCLMAYSLIGGKIHEWLGMAMFLLFFVHHLLNLCWNRAMIKGHYTAPRIVRTAVNMLLLIVMVLLAVSSVIMSGYAPWDIKGGIGGAVFCGLSFGDVPVCSNRALCISLHELPEPKKKIKNTLSEIGMCLTEQKK